MDESKVKNPFRSVLPRSINGARAKGLHIIICPFCENDHPIPTDFDSIHRCSCGACFKICATDTLEHGVGDIANTLWNDEELNFVRSVPIDFCNIVVEKDFDRLLDLKQHSRDLSGVERFCKYDVNLNLSLVWVKRLF
ncbi:MAG: hypothetical protein LLG06_10050 [Desulfobacteraceae bacterium]|nr:hypothetical protein [Desulfobacteraceae bacterium]